MIETRKIVIPKDIEKEITFMLYNYQNIDELIDNRKNELIDNMNVTNKAWLKSINKPAGTLEDVVMSFETDKKIMMPNEKTGEFEWFDFKNNRWRALDRNGEETEYHRHISDSDEEEKMEGEYPDDPTAITGIHDGLYPYSTHPVKWDVDGCYGIIGFKDISGNIVIEEQYEQVDDFFNGLCSVKRKDSGWGCIDKKGNTVISFKYDEPVRFNIYGVAVGDDCLIDINEEKLAGTELNFADSYFENDRYFFISLYSEEQDRAIERCGYADDLTVDIYDTKYRRYVVKGVPDCKLSIYGFNNYPEPEVIIAAVKILSEYDSVSILGAGTIKAEKDGTYTLFDYYAEDKSEPDSVKQKIAEKK